MDPALPPKTSLHASQQEHGAKRTTGGWLSSHEVSHDRAQGQPEQPKRKRQPECSCHASPRSTLASAWSAGVSAAMQT